MSADNWSYCPKCKKIHEKQEADLLIKAGESYGKVAPDEYIKLINEAKAPKKFKQTLREDYEFWLHDDTDLTIRYSAACSDCGFKFSFNKKINIETGKEI